ncbi:MAG: hypothetical protein FWD42_09360, partial [Solirubrobacterales bacterium]|nr:hypothetical protein [Solirubrobacterales bacterium]
MSADSIGGSPRAAPAARARAQAAVRLALGLVLVAALALGLGAGGSRASSESSPQALIAQPVIGLPVEKPVLIGSTPGESAGESWGYATRGREFQIVRYEPAGGWQIQPPARDAHGAPLLGFKPAPGPLGGRTTPEGGVAIVGEDASKADQLLVRNPHGEFAEATPPATLAPGETLFAPNGEGVLMAPVDQPGAGTAVFIVPFEPQGRAQSTVLLYDGHSWSREPICSGPPDGSEGCGELPAGFRVLALDATSTDNAWLLAKTGAAGEALALFQRTTSGGEARWVRRALGASGSLGASFEQAAHSVEDPATHAHLSVTIAPLTNGQPLTATTEGVWIDGQLTISGSGEPSSFTLYYDIAKGTVAASWCSVPPAAASLCTNPLESSLPFGPYRSFAWGGGGPFGQRAITGLPNGVTLELAGSHFEPILGLGGEAGTRAGAAFSSPQEGWLAEPEQLPLTHLTTQPA